MRKLKMAEADLAALARLMRKVEFFAPMTIGQLEMILPFILLCEYADGEVVFKQNGEGDAFYIVYDGEVGVRVRKGFFSFSKEVAKLKSGDFFGEMALLTREARTATIVCTRPSKLFVLMAADFDYVLKRNPTFKDEINKIAARRKFLQKHES
ncbi:MAG: cyclic nucleotide-binding domain-containing protein [Elusimicrobiota bacterium]